MKVDCIVRRRLLKGAAAAPVATPGGRLVAPYRPYDRPSTADPTTKFKGAWCHGQEGPTTNIELVLGDGLVLSARAQRDDLERDRPELPLRVERVVPAQRPLRFTSDPLQIVDARSGWPIEAPLTVRAHGRATLPPAAQIEPQRLRPTGTAILVPDAQAPHGLAHLSADAPAGFVPDAFILTGSTVILDAAPGPFPPVTLRWPAGVRSPSEYRSDAEQALLAARAAACRRETPQRACGNLLTFGISRSFELDAGPVRWRGRWARFTRRDGVTSIGGDLRVAPRQAQPRRFATNGVTLRDESAAAMHRLRFDRVEIYSPDGIARDAPLHVGRAAEAGESRVHIEALLPGGVPAFEVRLPALQAGAVRREVPPITFERRVFNGGIEPLNR